MRVSIYRLYCRLKKEGWEKLFKKKKFILMMILLTIGFSVIIYPYVIVNKITKVANLRNINDIEYVQVLYKNSLSEKAEPYIIKDKEEINDLVNQLNSHNIKKILYIDWIENQSYYFIDFYDSNGSIANISIIGRNKIEIRKPEKLRKDYEKFKTNRSIKLNITK